MNILICLIVALSIILIIAIVKIIIMKKSINEIDTSFNEIVKHDTNKQITITSSDKDIKKLAGSINESLKKMRKQEIEYEKGNNDLKKSITNISHDLRTPLTAIRGYIDLMHDESNLNENEKKYIKIIDNKTKNLVNLTEQLFDFSKSLDLYKETNKKELCINEILEETVGNYYELLKNKKINPTIEICEEKVIRNLDKSMLTRIFDNIISNAIKYTDKDLKISLDRSGKIIFENTAKTLDTTTVEKIFDRYYTVENGKKSTGVGLSIAKQLVELNNGTIEAKYNDNTLRIEIQF